MGVTVRHCALLERANQGVIGVVIVTSQGERVPQSIEIQHSEANIKGDMSIFVKNIENFISNYFCV